MSFKRQPILTLEEEEQLKNEMYPKWKSGLSGKQISEQLRFSEPMTFIDENGKITTEENGKEVPNPFTKIQPNYVYYYRQKFHNSKLNSDKKTKNKFYGKFPPRRKPAFAKETLSKNKKLRKTRYKHKPKELGLMYIDEFVDRLNKNLSGNSFYYRRARTFLIILFHTPLRSSEIYERTIDDFEITKTKIIIHLLRKKKKKHEEDDEPITIQKDFPLVDEVVDWLESEEWITSNNPEMRPWNISTWTARNYVKEFGEEYYPHFFRFNWISDEADQPGMSVRRLTTKTKLTPRAAEKYIFTTEKDEEAIDKEREERYRKRGMIK